MAIMLLACFTIFLLISGASGILKAANPPVRLSLHRLPHSTNLTLSQILQQPSLLKPAKTKPELFSCALGLIPGGEFDFHLPKWRSIQLSGLFRNLRAKTDIVDGDVVLDISGIEVPSASFSPEISLSPLMDDLQLSGGFSFKDRNFRGMGETFEVHVNRKEGLDSAVGRLPLSYSLHWAECNIGKKSFVSARVDREGLRDYAFNVQTHPEESEESYSSRVSTLVTKASAKLQR